MLSKKNLVPIVILALIIFSCRKDEAPDKTSPLGSSVTAKAILVTEFKNGPTPTGVEQWVSCYNPDGSQRWKIKLAGLGDMFPSYSKGLLYVASLYGPGGSPPYTSVSYGSIQAIEVATGKEVWKIADSSAYYFSSIVIHDTLLYVKEPLNSIYRMTALNPGTGASFGSYPISNKYQFEHFLVDGNTLYYVEVENAFNCNLCSFDLLAKTIRWKSPLGWNVGNVYSKPVAGIDKVFIKNGTGSLLAINKTDGSVAWSKNGPDNTGPIYDNGLVFTTDENKGVFAYNASDGSLKWQWKSNRWWWVAGYPFISGSNLYFLTEDKDVKPLVVCLNKNTGDENWAVNTKESITRHIVVGDEIYAMTRKGVRNDATNQITIMSSRTGIVKDSVELPDDIDWRWYVVNSEDKLITFNNK